MPKGGDGLARSLDAGNSAPCRGDHARLSPVALEASGSISVGVEPSSSVACRHRSKQQSFPGTTDCKKVSKTAMDREAAKIALESDRCRVNRRH
jgi:hypothetical protein